MCLNCQIINLSIPPSGLDPELKRIAKLIRDGKLQPGQIDAKMVEKMAKQLMAGVMQGYGSGALNDAEKSFLAQIENNVYVFSGFKNYQMLKEASTLLNDGGALKPFKDWLNDIKALNHTYNEVYASAEYGNAVGSMQAAASYNDFIANGIDMLRFQTAGDDRVRPDHAIMDGTTVAIDDPLLDTYYTPLDWGCRCEWVPAPGESRAVNKDVLPDVPPMFQNNVAKTGILFPDTHPYFNVSASVAKQVLAQVDDIKPATAIEKPEFYPPALDEYKKKLGIDVKDEIFTLLKEPVPMTSKSGSAFYHPVEKRVNIPIDARRKASKWYSEAVVYHEYGHAVDWQLALKQDKALLNLMAKYRKEFKKDGLLKFREIEKAIYKKAYAAETTRDIHEQIGAVADTLMALNPNFGYGHTKRYYSIAGKKEAEFIAHVFENRFIGNSVFKELMPDLYEDMVQLANKWVSNK